MRANELTREIIAAAIAVHRELGPGKPEAAYEGALAHELTLRGFARQVQKPVPVVYKGVKLDCGYRLDLLVEHAVVVEVKSVQAVAPVHRAQVLTYLKIGGWQLALLLNFNVAVLKDGINRLALGLRDGDESFPQPQQVLASHSPPTGPQFRSRADSGDAEAERLANEVIGAAIEVHRELGPGLLPSTYETCLCHELRLRGVPFETRRPLKLTYKTVPLIQSDEVRLLAGGRVVVTPHAAEEIEPVHEAEILSQLRLGGWRLGLLINFNSIRLREGLRRLVLTEKSCRRIPLRSSRLCG